MKSLDTHFDIIIFIFIIITALIFALSEYVKQNEIKKVRENSGIEFKIDNTVQVKWYRQMNVSGKWSS